MPVSRACHPISSSALRLIGLAVLITIGLQRPALPVAAQLSTESATPTATITRTATATPSETPVYNSGDVGGQIVTELEAAGVVPTTGQLLFQLKKSFASAASVGYNFLSVGKNQHAQNFALGFQINAHSQSLESACGVIFKASADDFHSLLISAAGRLSITHQSQAMQTVLYDQVIPQFMGRQSQHSLILTALDNTFTLYVNGHPIASVPDDTQNAADGTFALEVFNPLADNTITFCDYANLWLWSFDPVTPTPTSTPSLTASPTNTRPPSATISPSLDLTVTAVAAQRSVRVAPGNAGRAGS